MSDTAVAEPPAESTTKEKVEAIATFKRPGVFIKLYPTTSKEGKPAVYGRFARRRKNGEQWEDNPFVNSMTDFDFIIEACVEAKKAMRDFYRERDNGDDEE